MDEIGRDLQAIEKEKIAIQVPTPRTPLSEHLWHAEVGGGVGKRHR